jgi:hypothetical protein
MKTERLLMLIGIAIFLIVTSQTYFFVSPVNNTTGTALDKSTSEITSATTNTTANTTANTIGDNSIITSFYRVLTAIATGGVIAALAIYFLRPVLIEYSKKKNHAGYNR